MANEKHLYLTIQGSYKAAPLDVEIWQTGLRLALVFGSIDAIGTFPGDWNVIADPHTDSGTGWSGSTNWIVEKNPGDNFDPLDFLSQQVLPAVITWMGQAQISSSAYVQNLRLYPIGPDGLAVPAPPFASGTPAQINITSNTLADGGAGTTMLPLQISIVNSLRTQQVGRRGRGRMFQPGATVSFLQATANPTGGGTERGVVANAAATLMGDLTWTAGIGTAQTAPVVTGAPWVDYARVTQVRVGSVPDTQRRRRNALVEVVTSVDV